jgi:hypothetical protein
MAGFEQKDHSFGAFERQTTPCKILRLVQPSGVGCALPTLFHVHAYVDDHLLEATARTAKAAFAKAIEWDVVGRLKDVSINDGTSSLLKNLKLESFGILASRCWDGAVELDVIF